MAPERVRTVVIVGAGFSMYAGMPLQEDFTKALLSGRGAGVGTSGRIVEHLRRFVNRTFDHKKMAAAKYWPELEDIFTCLDLSANTGHNLGPKCTPSGLRTVRRALIYRIITMLRENYRDAVAARNEYWEQLTDLMQRITCSDTGFISTNWDTVVEDLLGETQQIQWYDYGCDAVRGSLHPGFDKICVEEPQRQASPFVIKMHGSVNWLYCEDCRRLFWLPSKETTKVAGQLLSVEEWEKIAPDTSHSRGRWSCDRCGATALGIRLATFSYLKALDFPMFQKSWFAAETILREAENWVFIGYSLPGADFEFKYLLKRVQLSRRRPPEFAVISGGDAAKTTYEHYQHFFGQRIRRETNFFFDGIDQRAIQYVTDLAGWK